MSVCSFLYLKKSHVQTVRNILHMLDVAVARSFSDDNATLYTRTSGFVDNVVFSRNGESREYGVFSK